MAWGWGNIQVVFIFGWTITWPFASKTESQKAFYRSIFTTSLTKAASDTGFWCFLWQTGESSTQTSKLLFENRSDDVKLTQWLKTHSPCQRPENYYLQNRDMSVAHFLPIFLDAHSGRWTGFKYCIIKHVPCQICSDVCLEKQVSSPLLNKVLFCGLTVSWTEPARVCEVHKTIWCPTCCYFTY